MNSNKSILPNTRTKFLYHLSDNEEEDVHTYLDEQTFSHFKNLHCYSFSFQPISLRESLREIQNDPTPKSHSSKDPDYKSLITTVKEKQIPKLFFTRAVEKYLAHEPTYSRISQIQMRCSSAKRLTAQEICTSFVLLQTLRETKKMNDSNIWLLREQIKKNYYKATNDVSKTFFHELAVLAYTFNFSSLTELKNSKCKEILEKLEELEESIYEKLHVKPISKGESFGNSPNMTGFQENKGFSQAISENISQNTYLNSEQRKSKKVPNLKLSNISSIPIQKSSMARTPRLQINNFDYVTDSPRDNENKALYKYKIQIYINQISKRGFTYPRKNEVHSSTAGPSYPL